MLLKPLPKRVKWAKCVKKRVMALQKDVQEWNKKNISHFYDVMLDVPIRELKLRR